MTAAPPFLAHLGLDADADDRAIRRAYARQLKQIDQEAEPEAFQALRQAYETALYWHASREQAGAQAQSTPAAQGPPDSETGAQPDGPEDVPEAAGATAVQAASASDAAAPEPLPARSSEDMARACLDALVARISETPPGKRAEARAWLDAALDSEQLLDMDARFLFEWGVASILANGWKPGHEFLFAAAMDCFGWRQEPGRLGGLGHAGMIVHRAIAELEFYDGHPDSVRTPQRDAIRQLRDPARPKTAVLLEQLPVVEQVAAQYPHWLHVITDVRNVARWQQWREEVPKWRRRFAKGARSRPKAREPAGVGTRYFWTAGIVLALSVLANLAAPPAKPPAPPLPIAGPTARLGAPSAANPAVTGLDQFLRSTAPASPAGSAKSPMDAAYLAPPRVAYPALARRHGWQGRVVVRVTIDVTGQLQQAEVVRRSGYPVLDDAALAAVRTAVFAPVKDAAGKGGSAQYTVPFNFSLSDTPLPNLPAPRSYGEVIRNTVLPHIVFSDPIAGNPSAEVSLQTDAEGRIKASRLIKSSGVKSWDAAVLRAVDRVRRLPADLDGRVPPEIVISFRPKNTL